MWWVVFYSEFSISFGPNLQFRLWTWTKLNKNGMGHRSLTDFPIESISSSGWGGCLVGCGKVKIKLELSTYTTVVVFINLYCKS